MGGGFYSISSDTGKYDASVRSSRLMKKGIDYSSMDLRETFKSRNMNSSMTPYNVSIRESRDSEDHPESLAIIISLDVTGSMGSIPHHLIKEGLPNLMGNIIQRGIKDPQVLFVAVGDHEMDNSPLQVGQFESSDELLDKWLTDVYLESGGGCNWGESYLLAWYFAGYHTSIDCFEKRQNKGYLFTIGDEANLPKLPKEKLKEIMGEGQYEDFTREQLLVKAQERYHVYHLHIKQGNNGNDPDVIEDWKKQLGQNLIIVDDYRDIDKKMSEIISTYTNSTPVITVSNEEVEQEMEEIL